MTSGVGKGRAFVLLGVVVAAAALAVVVSRSGSDYRLHLRLQNAGQLVNGNLVEVGGLKVGTVTGIELTDDNQADVAIRLTDGGITPLHRGTTAYVRVPSLSAVANRYIELHPGPNDAPALSDGATVAAHNTQTAVDIDAVQSTLDADTRARLQTIIHGGAQAYAGGGGRGLDRALRYLSPALAQMQATLGQVVADRPALERFLVASSGAVHALASHRDDLAQGLASTATTAAALSRDERALGDALRRAPVTLAAGTRTLRDATTTLDEVTPTARAARPAAPRLSRLLTTAAPVLRRGSTVLPRVRSLLPPLRDVLAGLPTLRDTAVPAFGEATRAVDGTAPIVDGTRAYLPDLYLGMTNGFGGTAAGYYDANGDYARIAFVGGPYAVSGSGSLVPAAPAGAD